MRTLLTEGQWRRIAPPLYLFRQAERLTRMKVVGPRRRKPGLTVLLQRWWKCFTG